LSGRGGGSVGARAGGDQYLRPDRDHGGCVQECAAETGVGSATDRLAGVGGGGGCVRCGGAPGGGGGGGGGVCGWAGPGGGGVGVLASVCADGVAVCGVCVRRRGSAGDTYVSHRGSGVLAR